jgi:hypothetical protein
VTGYRAFLDDVLAHPVQGPAHAEVLTDVTRNVTHMQNVIKMTGGDPEGIDGLIDAQLDRLIVASNGDQRLAMFSLAAALGQAMQFLTGMT